MGGLGRPKGLGVRYAGAVRSWSWDLAMLRIDPGCGPPVRSTHYRGQDGRSRANRCSRCRQRPSWPTPMDRLGIRLEPTTPHRTAVHAFPVRGERDRGGEGGSSESPANQPLPAARPRNSAIRKRIGANRSIGENGRLDSGGATIAPGRHEGSGGSNSPECAPGLAHLLFTNTR